MTNFQVLKFLKFMSDKKPKAGSTSLKEVWAASTLQEEMFTGASGVRTFLILHSSGPLRFSYLQTLVKTNKNS